jgi:hypothetical protein
MPCDVSSSFLPLANQAEVLVVGLLHHTVCPVRNLCPARSYAGASEKKRASHFETGGPHYPNKGRARPKGLPDVRVARWL